MGQRLKKILEIALFAGIVGLSAAVFFLRDRLQPVGPGSYGGLFLLCFLANSTVLLPSPSLMLAASCALIMPPLRVAATAALGSSAGELVGYAFGSAGRALSPRFEKLLERLEKRITRPLLLVFVLALLPLPLFDLAGIYSGGTRTHLGKFFLACLLGKFLKLLVYTRMYDILTWAVSLPPL